MGQPLGIFPISLVPLTSFDILSIGQSHDHAALQNIEDRLPVWTGAFHNYVRTVGSHQPLLDRLQISGESAELAHFHFRFCFSRTHHQAHRQGSLADVNPCAMGQYCRNHTGLLFAGGALLTGSLYDLAPRMAFAIPIGGSVTSARPV